MDGLILEHRGADGPGSGLLGRVFSRVGGSEGSACKWSTYVVEKSGPMSVRDLRKGEKKNTHSTRKIASREHSLILD